MARSGPRKVGGLALSTLLLIACTTGGTASPSATGAPPATSGPASENPASASPATSAEPSAEATLAPAEQSSVKLGIWLPNAGSLASLHQGLDKGYFKDEGLDVELIVVADTRAAVTGGSVDVGILDMGPVAQAISEGLAIQIASSYRCRRSYMYGVRPEIKTPADLSGKDVVLEWVAGEPDGNARKALLKEAGWDLDAITPPPSYVIIPGFSNAATKVFVAGKLFGMPVCTQTKTPTLEAGGRLLVDKLSDWPNDVVFANSDWIAKNPNTMAHLLRGIMRGVADTFDMSRQNDILALLKAQGVATENEEKTLAANPNAMILNQVSYCGNLYFDQQESDELLAAQGLNPMPTWDKLADIKPLLAAQQSMGLTNELPPPPGS